MNHDVYPKMLEMLRARSRELPEERPEERLRVEDAYTVLKWSFTRRGPDLEAIKDAALEQAVRVLGEEI